MKLSHALSNLVLVSSVVLFQNTRRIKSFFPQKDGFCRSQKSKIVCKTCCWECNDLYIGKTKRCLHDRKTDPYRALTGHIYTSAAADHTIKTGPNINGGTILKSWQMEDLIYIVK